MTLQRLESSSGHVSYWFFCDGCNTHHAYTTHLGAVKKGPVWKMTGTVAEPTFRPSLLVNGSLCQCKFESCEKRHVDPSKGRHRCHLFVTEGKVQYLEDCSHRLKGLTVLLQPPCFGD